MNFRIPSIEEIYNQYHRETFFAAKSFYPKQIKNFDKVLTNDKVELLTRFQNFIKRNLELVDWKLYIKACAQYFKRNFDLRILGSLNGNKIYRTYISYNKMSLEKSADDIKNDIVNSLKFLNEYCRENEMKLAEYLKDRSAAIPIILRHIYSGAVSEYLYACINRNSSFIIFSDITDDVFFELFNCSRNDFLQYNISQKRDKIICISELLDLINSIDAKFISLLR